MDLIEDFNYLNEQEDKEEVDLILQGIKQIEDDEMKDFDGVCERLVVKYSTKTV